MTQNICTDRDYETTDICEIALHCFLENSRTECLGRSHGEQAHILCHLRSGFLGQLISPLCASISSPVDVDDNSYLEVLKGKLGIT